MDVAFTNPVTAQNPFEDKTNFVNEQIMIVIDVSNNQDTPQNFAYLIQVRNNNDVGILLSWLTGSLSPKQSFSPTQSWILAESGTYYIQVLYVWGSIDNPSALSLLYL